ncbi:hypothetical protein HMPREF0636_0442 [Porphyromonas catoniae ATCC 51270]|uniref:Uncharacterized protein n=1 Tax=Porphyromonas catoniae ATCC 51270 TaxID=887901 RepID=Z4WVV4_9PORP|nr:hypothetical protein HMPREF0636_0442 [Porphyromonas catoniae ATCC 51270]
MINKMGIGMICSWQLFWRYNFASKRETLGDVSYITYFCYTSPVHG